MKQITVYSIKELEGEAKKRAISDYKSILDECFWDSGNDIVDSYKSCLKAFNITLKNYSIGAYDRGTFARLDIDDNIKELRGARALSWLENNGLNDLRITRKQYLERRGDFFSFGKLYRVGCIKPCPFTGICYDDDFLDSLINDVKSGSALEDAFNGLLSTCTKLLESESDYRSSEEYIMEELEVNEYLFTDRGIRL
jgi:hypothetical protein